MPRGGTSVFRFGPFVLDVADRSLRRDGVAVALTPKLFDLLVALVAKAGVWLKKTCFSKQCGRTSPLKKAT
jgi:DNA-binding winged helix-turn-helix (wHTH) protein